MTKDSRLVSSGDTPRLVRDWKVKNVAESVLWVLPGNPRARRFYECVVLAQTAPRRPARPLGSASTRSATGGARPARRSRRRPRPGPMATTTGGRLRQAHLWDLVRRLARTAGIGAWEQLSPHSLRHSAISFALDAGASLRDVQDYAGHKDPRMTRRYDHSRDSLDRHAAYTVAAYLA
jgi:integrase